LVRTGTTPLAQAGRARLTGYPGAVQLRARVSSATWARTRRRGWSRSVGCDRPPFKSPPSGGGRTARDGIVCCPLES